MTKEHERKLARLRRIKLDELSLVDRPANPLARVTLFKRAPDDDFDKDGDMLTTKQMPRG